MATNADKAAVKAREDEQRGDMYRSNLLRANIRCAYCGIPRVEMKLGPLAYGPAPLEVLFHIRSE